MQIISLNWTDNTGKTTHSKLLTLKNTYNIALIWSISNYNNRWQTDANQKERWTNNHNEEDFVSLFVESILARNNAIENLKNVDIAILDRGLTMIESSIISNLQIKKWISKENAKYLFENFVKNNYGEIKNVEDASILLRYSDNIGENIDYTISNQDNNFSSQENERYKIYQRYLNERLIENFTKFDFLIKANVPIVTTQNAIRNGINEKFGYDMPLFGENIDTICGVGWSSESWKSSFWEISRKNHNLINLKLKYFSEIIQKNHPNLSPDSEEFGLYMATEIDNFADVHYYFKKYSFESLRYPKSVKFFKKFWGEKFKSIFIDADKDIRIGRYACDNNIKIEEAINKVADKDEAKRKEWAFEIEKISDFILNNNESFDRWKQKIANFYVLNEYERNNSYRNSDLSNLWLPEKYLVVIGRVVDICENVFKENLRLLVLAWSAGRQDIISDFSDLDLFLVIDNTTEYTIKDFKSKYRFFDNIKVGYTFIDSTTVENLGFDAKVSYIFRNIHNCEFPILYWNNIKLPLITMDKEINLRKKEISLYVNNTEEEINNAVMDNEMFEVIKHIHTIMKMLLLIYWVQKEWYRSVYNSFYETFKESSFIHIPCIIDILWEEQIKEKYAYALMEFIKTLKNSLKNLINIS